MPNFRIRQRDTLDRIRLLAQIRSGARNHVRLARASPGRGNRVARRVEHLAGRKIQGLPIAPRATVTSVDSGLNRSFPNNRRP